ncbi:MAG: response regulator [Nitrospinae bacterium]|nr:response regulator [Nitrospinota bacterium]
MGKILICDDSAYQRSILRKYMEEDGHAVTEAMTGKEAVEKASSPGHDLMLLDLLMPDMSGLQVLEALAAKGVKMPVVVVSADIQETVKKNCMNQGAVGFVNKPVKGASLEGLRNIIKAYSK